MEANKKRRLETTITNLQDRWGSRAIHRLRKGQTAPPPHVPTGFAALDEALVIGGLPQGRISELIGIPTSGMATIALKIAANAQRSAGIVIYLDLGHTFDPDYAARCGLELSQLILVRPPDISQALAILQDFILNGGVNILLFDTPFSLMADPRPAQALANTLGRLIAPLSKTNCILLFLTSLPASALAEVGAPKGGTPMVGALSLNNYPNSSTLPHFAAIRLLIQRERWLYKQRDIRGYQARVLVIKNKLGPAGVQASIAITFNGTVAGNENHGL